MLVLERPALLALALAIPALVLLVRRLASAGLGLRFPLASAGGEAFDGTPFPPRALRAARSACLLLAALLLVLAAAGPAAARRASFYAGRGNEIILVLDLSPSMAAADIAPTRLEAAKAIVRDFLAKRRNETVGLVAFGAEAALVSPPTRDYAALAARLEELEPGAWGDGTAIGSGIATALAHSRRSSAPEKSIVLLTDGETNAGPVSPATAAELASRAGVALSVVGVGSRGEAPVDWTDPATGERRSGIYRSGFDRGVLESLARLGGGRYHDAADAAGLAAAFSAVDEGSSTRGAARSIVVDEPLAAPLLAAALVLLVLARLLSLAGGGGLP